MTVKGLYTKMEGLRFPYLNRARDAARITIPGLIPEDGHSSSTILPTPYQGVGARGVNNLSSALLLSLLPPNAPFFRLVLGPEAKKEIEGLPEVETEVETSLSEMERTVMQEIESGSLRVATFEALKHLVVAGNILIHFPDEGGMRVFHLDRYVVKRDPMGNVQKIVVKETVAHDLLPKEIQDQLPDKEGDVCDIYTCVETVKNGKTEVFQEVGGMILENTRGTYAKDMSPWLALRMSRIDGEDYGRGYVEEYRGDLNSLEALSQAIVEGTAASAKVLFMVNPNGTTRARSIARAPNGGIVEGNANDVSTLQVQKYNDFRVALETIAQIRERLNYAFMLTEASIRHAERVTAEEIRLVTQSIERQLGGIYSVLSQEFQLPLVKILMSRMGKKGTLPKLPKNFVTPMVITGIEGLGRGNDLNKLDSFVAGIGQILGPQVMSQFIDVREYLNRRATSLGLDTKGLIKTEEELAMEAQNAQMAQMAQTLGPDAIKAGTEMSKEAINNG